MDGARIDYRHEVSGDVMVTWYFGRTFREMAAESNHWAILDRQAVFHLGSKYSVLLFQHIASLQNLKHVTSKRFTVPDLRAMFGMSDGKFSRFADLNKHIIKPVIAEINASDGFSCFRQRQGHPALGSYRAGQCTTYRRSARARLACVG